MAAGLDIEQFGRLTLGEVARVLRGRRTYEQARFEATRAANYELANLIAAAVHKPQNLPQYKPVSEQHRPQDRKPTEADHDRIRALFISLAARQRKEA